MDKIILKPGRERSVLRKHPWIFSGSIEKVSGEPQIGDTVAVYDSNGIYLATGAYSPDSQIRVRIWTWKQKEEITSAFFRSRLESAISLRKSIINFEKTHEVQSQKRYRSICQDACRLVYAESDRLPGLVVDRYGEILVVQLLTAGIERWREEIFDLLQEVTGIKQIYERSDVDVRRLEGLEQRAGLMRGNLPDKIIINEHDLLYHVSVDTGHKTGFYLDQKANRRFIQGISNGKEVLDCFAYTGGFSLNALKGGAKSVVAIEISKNALNIAKKNQLINGFNGDRVDWLEADVFKLLRKFRDEGRKFDLIILDPPKFAPTSSQVSKASRGYKDINLFGFKLLRSGGYLATFSCSGGVSQQLFQKIVADAALDANVHGRIIRQFHQSPDHPIAVNFPEGAYLKGLLVRVE
jgi:23S rRNA (cytosine1962-C5)-methyltransferase